MSADPMVWVALIVGLLVALPASLALAAALLKLSCRIVGIQPPGFVQAMAITFTLGLVGSAIAFLLCFFLLASLLPDRDTASPQQWAAYLWLSNLINVPVSAVTVIGLLIPFLGTTVGRATLVWLIHLGYGVVFAGIAYVAMLGLNVV